MGGNRFLRPMGLDRDTIVRRGLHVASPLLLVYYLLPEDLGVGVWKGYGAVAVWTVTLAIEAVRLTAGFDLIGLREYEQDQVSAYFWGGTGLLLGFLFFPVPFVVVAVCGMAWVDPLCALTRRGGGYPYVPLGAYLALAVVGLRLLTPWSLPSVAALATVGAAVMVAVEFPNLRYVDDDFTTQVAPLAAMTGLWLLL